MQEDIVEETAKPRNRQIASGNYTRTLLNSLTLDQIREAAFLLNPQRRIQIPRHSEAEKALNSIGCSTKDLQKTLLDVETRHPFKHCLLLRLTGELHIPKHSLLGQHLSNGDIDFRLANITTSPNISLTFEHTVQVQEWVEISKDTRKKRLASIRQPIVVRLLPDSNLATLNYPGFTHNRSENSGNAGYERVVEALIAILKKDFSLSLRTLPTKRTLGLFLEGPNKRVLRVKADVDSPLARLDVSAKQQAGTIEEALSAFFHKYLDGVEKQALIEAAKKAFNDATLNSIVLFWLQESLFTKLHFWDIGTEIFFVWNKENPNYRIVDTITRLLSSAHEDAPDGGLTSLLAWISQQESLKIITPADFSMTHSLEPGMARDVLIRAMAGGLVEPVYRIKTNELIIETPNHWTPDLQSFKRMLSTDSGKKIDGGDPENIEVAFQRIGVAASGSSK